MKFPHNCKQFIRYHDNKVLVEDHTHTQTQINQKGMCWWIITDDGIQSITVQLIASEDLQDACIYEILLQLRFSITTGLNTVMNKQSP